MQQAQEAQTRIYNQSANIRTFLTVETALLMVPTLERTFYKCQSHYKRREYQCPLPGIPGWGGGALPP